jgi:hypothetical protein
MGQAPRRILPLPAFFFRHLSRSGLLVLGALLPLVLVLADPTGLLPGTELGDVYKHAWSYWHTPEALGAWPWTHSLNAPAGGVLWDVMLMPSLLMAPFQWFIGPVLSANIWVFLSIFMVGYTTARLVQFLGADLPTANVAGFLAQGAPYLYGYPLYSGVHERLAIWVFPLLILCALQLKAGGSRKWILLGVSGFAFAAAGCGVYGIWALLMMGLALPFVRSKGAPFFGFQRQFALYVGLGLVALLLLVAMQITAGSDSLSPQPDRFSLWGVNWGLGFSQASLSDLFSPSAVHAQKALDSGDLLLELSYVGWVQFLVCCVGLRHDRTRWLCGLALTFLVLSMGPVVALGSLRVINPLYWVAAWIMPTYGSAPVPFQQMAVFSSLAGLGVLAVMHGRSSRRGLWLFLIVLSSVVERAVVLPTGLFLETADARVSPVYSVIDQGTVVELPRDYKNRALSPGRLFLAQTQHEQGLPVSVSTGVTAWDGFLPIRSGISNQWAEDLDCLKRGGFSWIVWNKDAYLSPDIGQEMYRGIREVLGEPVSEKGPLSVFSLDSVPSGAAENRFLPPFQVLESVDNGGRGPPSEQAQIAPAIRSGRETSFCPLNRIGMPK